MSLGIGIVGLGFMGKMHFDTYARLKGVRVAAIADVDPVKRRGDWSGIQGNIGARGKRQDLSGIRVYEKAGDLLRDPAVDVADITLPTCLHARWVGEALKAGRHVICEKPMALSSADADAMAKAARAARRRLFVAQCIRFWPAYAKARELTAGKSLGRLISAVFTRVSRRPIWSWNNWYEDPRNSGGCALDLHIHDADFLLYLLGAPESVQSRAVLNPRTGPDHITTQYHYASGAFVQAEGAWEYNAAFPFSMSFRLAFEKGTLHWAGGDLLLCPLKGSARKVSIAAGDGYFHELRHFTDCIRRGCPSPVVPPESAAQSVRLIEAEVRSARTGRSVKFA